MGAVPYLELSRSGDNQRRQRTEAVAGGPAGASRELADRRGALGPRKGPTPYGKRVPNLDEPLRQTIAPIASNAGGGGPPGAPLGNSAVDHVRDALQILRPHISATRDVAMEPLQLERVRLAAERELETLQAIESRLVRALDQLELDRVERRAILDMLAGSESERQGDI